MTERTQKVYLARKIGEENGTVVLELIGRFYGISTGHGVYELKRLTVESDEIRPYVREGSNNLYDLPRRFLDTHVIDDLKRTFNHRKKAEETREDETLGEEDLVDE